jgi:tRNA(adenine34) deaminase
MTGAPDNGFMTRALELARQAVLTGEVPVGALVVSADGVVLAEAHNRTLADRDPTAHAEILALRAAAARRGSERLVDCDLYVTLEPCAMCAGAISLARIRRLYYGAMDEKSGGVDHGARVFSHATCHHAPEVYGGLSERQASALMKGFFATLRD